MLFHSGPFTLELESLVTFENTKYSFCKYLFSTHNLIKRVLVHPKFHFCDFDRPRWTNSKTHNTNLIFCLKGDTNNNDDCDNDNHKNNDNDNHSDNKEVVVVVVTTKKATISHQNVYGKAKGAPL